ncbi:MAG: hypothetical protein ORO03_09030, partial [Alphaproteobacteria bacterium]|nr:hypothetical protein [Alphaproteobacteria bacterium]
DVTLLAANERVTIDLGTTGLLLGSPQKIVASGLAVNFNGSGSGHSSSIQIGSGSFKFIADHSDITDTVTLDGNLMNSDATRGWSLGFSGWSSVTGGFAAGGMTILTTRTLAEVSTIGVRFGGVVLLSGIGTGTGNLKNLSYIEAAGIKTIGSESAFVGSLTLVSAASSLVPGVNFDEEDPPHTAGIFIASALRAGTLNDGVNSLTLRIKKGGVGRGIFVNAAVTAGGNLVFDSAVDTGLEGVYFKNAAVSSGGTITVTQSGNYTGFGVKLEDATVTAKTNLRISSAGGNAISGRIFVLGSTLTATGDLLLEQTGTGTAQGVGLFFDSSPNNSSSSLKSLAGSVTLRQAGNSLTKGLSLHDTTITAGLDINLISSGTLSPDAVGVSTFAFDIDLDAGHSLTAGGAARRSVIFQSANQDLKVTNLTVLDSQLRLLLGTGKLVGAGTIHAVGLKTYYAAAKTGSDAVLNIGKGRFLFITNHSETTVSTVTQLTVTDTTGLSWDAGSTPVDSGWQYSSGTLRVVTQGDQQSVKTVGAVYAGDVVLNGITRASDMGNISYLEARSIVAKTSASFFNGRITLVSTGSGADGAITAGINLGVGVTVGAAGDGTSDLQLINQGTSTGFGIYLGGAVVAGGNLSLLNLGATTQHGLSLNGATSLSAGRDIMLENRGSLGNPSAAGIFLYGTVFKGSGTTTGLVILKTANQNLTVTSSATVANIVQQARLRIDLGTGYSKSAGTLTASGLNLYYTGGLTPDGSNSVTLDVGSGNFVYVADRRNFGADIALDGASNSASDGYGWGSGLGFSGSGSLEAATGLRTFTSNSGISLKTSGGLRTINGLGVVYDSAVTMNGVGAVGTSGTADDLRYIEARSISITGASSFNGSLTLVSNGADAIGVTVNASLTTKVTADGVGDLVLIQQGGAGAQASGIELQAGAEIYAAGRFTAVQRGYNSLAGIRIARGARFTSGGTIEFNQNGLIASENGIVFNAVENQVLQAGNGSKNWVVFRTRNQNLSLVGGDLTVADSRLLVSLGSGVLTGGQAITATGGDVYFAGGSSNHSASFHIGTGSFFFVTDRSSSTEAVTLTSTTTATDAAIGWNSTGLFFSNGTGGGLTVNRASGTFATSDQKFAVIYGGAVTIQAASAAVRSLNTIVGASISVTAANSFSGEMSLLTSGGDFSSTGLVTAASGLRIA